MQDRIYVGWPGGYFLTTAGPIAGSEFVEQFHEMVAELGRPDVVEFRAADEGYIDGSEDEDEGEEHAGGNYYYSAVDY